MGAAWTGTDPLIEGRLASSEVDLQPLSVCVTADAAGQAVLGPELVLACGRTCEGVHSLSAAQQCPFAHWPLGWLCV